MKTVVITGAGSGMGLAATKLFLQRGWRVLMVDVNAEAGERERQALAGQGFDQVYFKACNLAVSAQVAALADYAHQTLGRIDSLINNAGIWRGGELHETSEADWDVLFDVDVKSIFLMKNTNPTNVLTNSEALTRSESRRVCEGIVSSFEQAQRRVRACERFPSG